MKSFIAVAALATFAAQPVVPISDIFVRDPEPEWSVTHESSGSFWDGHNAYHKLMEATRAKFETLWTMKPKDEAYQAAKRDLLIRLQREHRSLHQGIAVSKAQVRAVAPAGTQLVQPVGVPSHVSARVTPLPKRSHRLLVKEYYKQLEYRRK